MYLRIGQVAWMLGLSVSTLRRWDDRQVLAASYKAVGGHRRYDLRSVQMWLKKTSLGGENFDEEVGRGETRTQVVVYARVSASKQKRRFGQADSRPGTVLPNPKLGNLENLQRYWVGVE